MVKKVSHKQSLFGAFDCSTRARLKCRFVTDLLHQFIKKKRTPGQHQPQIMGWIAHVIGQPVHLQFFSANV